MAESDEELFRFFLDGDEIGLRKLMDKYGNKLTLYINGYTHDINEAEDLMIEAFSRIIAKKPRLGEMGFKPYLFKTGRNLALRYKERAVGKSRLELVFDFDDFENEPDAVELLEDVVQSKEECRILQLAMKQLSHDYCEVLYLLFFEELSYSQIAQIMKKSNKQIDNLAYRAKQALKPLLIKEGITNAQYK